MSEQTKSSESEKPKEPGGFIVHDKINPYKIMLVVDMQRTDKLTALGLAEELKDVIKITKVRMIEDKKRLSSFTSKLNFKNFIGNLKK
jgi:hypothetical protein